MTNPPKSRHLRIADDFDQVFRCPLFRGFTVLVLYLHGKIWPFIWKPDTMSLVDCFDFYFDACLSKKHFENLCRCVWSGLFNNRENGIHSCAFGIGFVFDCVIIFSDCLSRKWISNNIVCNRLQGKVKSCTKAKTACPKITQVCWRVLSPSITHPFL